MDELKLAPNDERDGGLSAPELAKRALDRELNATAPPVRQEVQVNDLTSMVVKKKKKAPVAPEASVSGAAEKRKAEDNGEGAQTLQDKKARLEESPAAP